MNYTECFNRSRAAICLQPVFYFFAPVLVPSLASGMEYCHGCTFAPVCCPRWHQAWSIATDAHLRPFVALVGIRHGVLPRMHICARSGALVGIRHGVLPRMHICALSGALVGIRHGVLPRMHICARSGALVGIRHGVLPRMHICALSEAHSITLYTL